MSKKAGPRQSYRAGVTCLHPSCCFFFLITAILKTIEIHNKQPPLTEFLLLQGTASWHYRMSPFLTPEGSTLFFHRDFPHSDPSLWPHPGNDQIPDLVIAFGPPLFHSFLSLKQSLSPVPALQCLDLSCLSHRKPPDIPIEKCC